MKEFIFSRGPDLCVSFALRSVGSVTEFRIHFNLFNLYNEWLIFIKILYFPFVCTDMGYSSNCWVATRK